MTTAAHFFGLIDKFVEKVVDNPAEFASEPPAPQTQNVCDMTKTIYDFGKHHVTDISAKAREPIETDGLPELIVDGLDCEQIWEEIQLVNNPVISHFETAVESLTGVDSESKEEGEDGSEGGSDEDSGEDSEEEIEDSELEEEEEEDSDDEGMEESTSQSEEEEPPKKKKGKTEASSKKEKKDKDGKSLKRKKDDFFDEQEMLNFLDEEDELAMNERSVDDDKDLELDEEEEDEEEEVDFLSGAGNEEEGDEEDEEDEDEDEEGDEEEEEGEEEDEDDLDGDDLEELEAGLREDLLDSEEEEEEKGKSKERLTSFEKMQRQIAKKTKELEEKAVGAKEWSLKGEVRRSDRPVNSLLEEYVEFDQAAKPVPVITQTTTKTLEELIKKRIKDEAFDDVVRKVEVKTSFRPKVELSSEKPKVGLAEEYEQEYMKQAYGKADVQKLEKNKQEMQDLFSSICRKLDRLSNFNFTPKVKDMEVIARPNAPAIAMEEVLPMGENETQLLAPEEIYEKKKTEVKEEHELTSQERKARRAAKKRRSKGKYASKESGSKKIKTLKVDANTNKGSSSDLFQQLQREVRGEIKGKSETQASKRQKTSKSSVLKL